MVVEAMHWHSAPKAAKGKIGRTFRREGEKSVEVGWGGGEEERVFSLAPFLLLPHRRRACKEERGGDLGGRGRKGRKKPEVKWGRGDKAVMEERRRRRRERGE